MSSWRKCDTCRKVLPVDDFDGDATTCRACLAPAPARRRASAVTTTRPTTVRAPAPAATPAGPRAPLLGSTGRGDLEVRERRAKRTAADALAELHPLDGARLLRAARAAEGLRPLAEPAPVESAPVETAPVEPPAVD